MSARAVLAIKIAILSASFLSYIRAFRFLSNRPELILTQNLGQLTARQSEILELVAKGFTNIEIGELLELSAGTVKVHVSAIIDRLEVTNRTEAATIWLRQRLSAYITSKPARSKDLPSELVCVLPFTSHDAAEDGDSFSYRAWTDICETLKKNGLPIVDSQTAGAIVQAGLSNDLIRDNLGAAIIVKGAVDAGADADVISVDCADTKTGQSLFSSIYRVEKTAPDITLLDIAIDLLKCVRGAAELDAKNRHNSEQEKDSLEEYWRGRYNFSLRTPQSLFKSCEHYQAALSHNEEFTDAHVGLANAAHQIGYYGEAAQGFFYEMGRKAAMRAVALDPHSAPAHGALAYSQLVADWDFAASEKSFERARHLDPDYDEALMWYSLHSMIVGDETKARTLAEEGLSKNPMAIPHFVHIGHVSRSQSRYEDAIEHLNIAVEMEPGHIRANIWLALTHADIGDFAVANKFCDRMLAANGRVSALLGISGYIAGLSGDKSQCDKLIAEIQNLPNAETFAALYIAFCHVGAGAHDRAIEWVEKALDQRPPLLLGWRCDPIFFRLREHESYDRVSKLIGLPD